MRRRRCARPDCRKLIRQNPKGRPRNTCSDACRQALYRHRNRRLKTPLEVMGSSRSDEWPTDPAFFARLEREFGPFDLDPCATVENAKCPRYFTRADDGLAQEWTGRVYVNPPYGRPIGLWMQKAFESAQTTAELVVCLVPARTDTRWWHDWAARGEVRLLKGRQRFGDGKTVAPFPSALIIFRNAEAVTKQAVRSLIDQVAEHDLAGLKSPHRHPPARDAQGAADEGSSA